MATATSDRANRYSERYTGVSITLHWVTAALVVLNISIGIGSEAVFRGWIPVHKAIGITVLALTAARVLWRLGHPWIPLPRDIPAWQRALARTTHLAFYALLIALPFSGWMFSSAAVERRPLTWFGLFDIPYLPVTQAREVAGPWFAAHGPMAFMLLLLILLHVAGALKHQFVDRNALISRLLPRSGG